MAMNDASYIALQLQAMSSAQTAPDLGIPLDGSVPFSVDAWVSLDGLCSHASILSKDGVFSFGIAGDALVFAIEGFPPVYSNPSKQPLTEVDWHYVCATFASNQVRLYVDGAFNALQGISGSGQSAASPFLIGEDLQAEVSCVRVYNQALDASTVMANMFNDPPTGSVGAWFDFSQAPPKDIGPRKLPLTLSPGAAMLELTPSLSLGSTAYAEPHRDAHVNPGGGQVDPYTVQAWVHVEGIAPAEQAVFANGDLDGGDGMALLLEYDSGAAGFRVASQRGSSNGGDVLTSTATFTRGAWANVATTFDGTTLTVYVDGVAAGTRACGPIAVGRLTGQPMIGAAPLQGQPISSTTLQGFISRMEVWRRSLSAAEIAQYMAAAPPVGIEDLEGAYDFTTSPARNQHDRDPVGLVDGASLETEVSAAGPPRARPTTLAAAELEPPPAPLDEATIAGLLDELDFGAFLRDHEGDLQAAAAFDEQLFAGNPEGQQQIRAAWQDAMERLRTNPRSLPFLMTSHTIGEDYVVLCHTPRGTHVAMRMPVADLDPCTQWKVELVFCVVAGLLSALFGLSARLSQGATDFIGRVLRHPTVVSLLARGKLITAAGIYALGYALWSLGFLKTLVTLVVELGFWALLRVVAKFLLKLIPGLGAADVIASLVATAVSFVYIYTQRRPASCSELPSVDISAIKFNWDASGAAVDALSIRRNYAKHIPVAEWTKGETGAAQSPAAYAIADTSGKTVTIQAKFVISDPTVTSAQVQASGGGVLGAIDPFTVTFKNGISDPDFVTIALPHHTLPTGGVQRTDIAWTWSYKPTNGDWTPLTTTNHRIYVVLAVPTAPWTQSATPSSDTQVPWTELLDYACEWAAGATTPAAVATAITKKVNSGLGLSYDTHGGAGAYTEIRASSRIFLGTEFMKLLGGTGGKGKVVNCSDCASIVTTFANALGCDLTESTMNAPDGQGFDLNKIMAIGATVWAYPFVPPNPPHFSYHEVAWTGTNSYIDGVYDACLQVDAGVQPWNWTDPSVVHTPELPLALTFSTLGPTATPPLTAPFTASSYRERLAANSAAGFPRCLPQGPKPYSHSGRRKLV